MLFVKFFVGLCYSLSVLFKFECLWQRYTVQLQCDLNIILAFQTVKIKLLRSLCQHVFI